MEKKLFDEAIGEAPPSTVDLDGVVARERRAAWVRRVANPWAATAGAVVAVAVGAAAILAPGDPERIVVNPAAPPTPAPTVPQTPETTWSACPGNTPTAPPVREKPADALPRLSATLTAAVQGQAPRGTKLEANPAAEYPKGTRHGPLEFFHVYSNAEPYSEGPVRNGCKGGEDYFMSRATTVSDGVKGNILATIGRIGGVTTPQTECRKVISDVEITCDREVAPGGEIVVTTTLTHESGMKVYQVDVTKKDGTGIILTAGNAAADSKKDKAEGPNPPLTHEQLTRIALDPGMTLYP